MFRWDTLRELGPDELRYRPPVAGTRCEIELVTGEKVLVWRAEDRERYFCHGLTFGGKDAPGGPISPYSGGPVETMLRALYDIVPDERDARPGDIIVFRGPGDSPGGSTPHSAILTDVVPHPGRAHLDSLTSRAQTKNGMLPENNVCLDDLFLVYGETYEIYRRKEQERTGETR